MAKACIAFGMDSATEAWRHLMGDRQLVINYGNEFEGKYLHTWDDGERILFRCKECGGYFLYQTSEYHGRDDSYYHDFFPVTGPVLAPGDFNQYAPGDFNQNPAG